MLPAVTRVTLLPKRSQVNLLFKWMYLCPSVTCVYPCYRYPNTVTKIGNLSDICVPMLPVATRVTLLPKHSH